MSKGILEWKIQKFVFCSQNEERKGKTINIDHAYETCCQRVKLGICLSNYKRNISEEQWIE